MSLCTNGFSGTLPSNIGLLAHLSFLYIPTNQFEGSLPDAMSQLAALQFMQLSGTGTLNGTIPSWLALLTRLT